MFFLFTVPELSVYLLRPSFSILRHLGPEHPYDHDFLSSPWRACGFLYSTMLLDVLVFCSAPLPIPATLAWTAMLSIENLPAISQVFQNRLIAVVTILCSKVLYSNVVSPLFQPHYLLYFSHISRPRKFSLGRAAMHSEVVTDTNAIRIVHLCT